MIEIRWNGRGGQGAFTASKLLGAAAVKDGEYGLAFPSFGPERRGAPMEAFTKISNDDIRDRSEPGKFDYIIYLDSTLYKESAKKDLKPGGVIIVNQEKATADKDVISIPANELAKKWFKRPVTNTILLGGLIHHFNLVSKDAYISSLVDILGEKVGTKNQQVMNELFTYLENEDSNDGYR